jgi:hypothetical protein
MRFICITIIPDLWLYNAILTGRQGGGANYTLNKPWASYLPDDKVPVKHGLLPQALCLSL